MFLASIGEVNQEMDQETPGAGDEEVPQNRETKQTTEGLAARTPIKERIRKINSRAETTPGKFPGLKQARMGVYMTKKSPKAQKVREKMEGTPETTHKKTQGLAIVPFWEIWIILGLRKQHQGARAQFLR